MRHNISSDVSRSIFWGFGINVVCTYAVIFLWDTTKEKTEKLNYHIEEWHKSTPYDRFRNESTYPTVCLVLETWQRNYHFITVYGEWIFDSNFEVAFPLTQDCSNYTCRGNDTDEITFVGVLHAIISVTPEVVQRISNMK